MELCRVFSVIFIFPSLFETICPKYFEGGSVSESCSRKYKATCSEYQCNPGYTKLSRAYAVQCYKSGDWVNPDERYPACVREDQLCPYTFPGGYVWNCNRIPQDSCSYYCYSACNMQIPHGEINWWCATIGQTCTYSCHEGYKQSDTVSFLKCSTSGQWVPSYPYWLDGVQFSIQDLCTHMSNISSSLTFRTTSPAATTRKTALSSELRKSISDERSGVGNVGAIVGISVGTLTGILIIVVFILVWYGKRISVPNIRDAGHVTNTCLRPRENPVRNVTTIRQQHHADDMGSVSSFDSPSYNGLYVHPYVQRISTISNSCKYHGPPPSYNSIQPKESLPTYEEVTRNPSKFNLYI
ncbi:hypothetical protein CHS0354_002980 [Potamilus streckersoni]|uniref:Sushi domain-containing protein n=1 Tax=Potamilus streckersoni TaxID=2493646 RepID=A0AAE0RS86_9BIVA|nr:hypothetical protein CHS0354_002980 [Potamilus streckersoni]